MTDEEVQKVQAQIAAQGATPWITSGSDIESYFCNVQHIALRLNREPPEIVAWIGELVVEHQLLIQHSFTRKRDEVKALLYRNQNEGNPPDTLALLGNFPFTLDKWIGKFLLKKMHGSMHAKFGVEVDLIEQSQRLALNDIRAVFGAPLIAAQE